MDAKWVSMGRNFARPPPLVLLALAATVGVACGQADPEAISPPFATAITASTLEPEPSPEPAPTTIAATLDEPTYVVARDDLPRMILAPSDVSVAIPEIRKQIEDMEKLSGGGLSTGRAFYRQRRCGSEQLGSSGHRSSLAERGRIIGYRDNFFDASALYVIEKEPAGPFQVFTGVQMFVTGESASEWLARSFQVTRNSVGQTRDRVTLIDVTETPAPELGDRALILRIIASFSGPTSIDVVTLSLRWCRGPIVAVVQMDTVNSESYTSAVLQLALSMDARINGVLTGAK